MGKGYFESRLSSGGMQTGGGRFATNFKQGVGITNNRGDNLAREAAVLRDEQMGQTRGVLDQMNANDETYKGAFNKTADEQLTNIKNTRQQASDQATDATTTYKGQAADNAHNMEGLRRDVGDAMSLKDAGDPNNSVQTAVRGMYEQQAQGVNKTGLASAGVLQNLGAQAFANQAGGGVPMTGGQMQMMAGQSQQQAGDAYARTQQHMQGLRDQGIERGFSESDKQYQRGVGARQDFSAGIDQGERLSNNYQSGQRGYRDEMAGYDNQSAGINYGKAGVAHDLAGGQSQRELGYQGEKYGGQQGQINSQIAASNASQAAKMGMATGTITAAATGVGGYMGGTGGAKEGNKYGQQLGGVMQTQSVPTQQTNYGPPQNAGYPSQVGGYGSGNPYEDDRRRRTA